MAAQIAAVTIFLVMFLLIILEKFERHIITLGCAALTLILVFGVGNALVHVLSSFNLLPVYQ